MRGRRRLAVSLVTLLTVWASFVLTPREPALAAEPTLEEAIAQQRRLEQTLVEQRVRLDELGSSRTSLESTLAQVQAELNQIATEYDAVSALLVEVRGQVADIEQQLSELRAQIADLDAQLGHVQAEIRERSQDLAVRERLLQDHIREAYERSQTSFLEAVIASPTLGEITNQVGYLLSVSDRERELADGVRDVREELRTKRRTLAEGRRAADAARDEAEVQAAELAKRQQELSEAEARLAELRVQADARRAQEQAALDQLLADQQRAEQVYQENVAAHEAQEQLVVQLQAEAERRAREAEEARRREAERAAQAAQRALSAAGFRWPMDSFLVTQEFGPTGVWLEPPAVWKGTYYAHFHEGIDLADDCGAPIVAASAGVVIASGQPNPASDGFGVVISHGGALQTWYWHLTPEVVVQPGQQVATGQVLGYEGNTGYSTGCHLHFAVHQNGDWENPRNYLP
ncbi:MAG: murein hydrolase activator EnvC [Candidatus Limnocylindria bacterium]